jgi:hypothetical protein
VWLPRIILLHSACGFRLISLFDSDLNCFLFLRDIIAAVASDISTFLLDQKGCGFREFILDGIAILLQTTCPRRDFREFILDVIAMPGDFVVLYMDVASNNLIIAILLQTTGVASVNVFY